MNRKLFIVLLLVAVIASTAAYARSITGSGKSQGDLVAYLEILQARLLTGNCTYANIHSQAAASASLDIGTTFTYTINGTAYQKVASDSVAGFAATAQATGTACMYLFSVDTTGAVTTTKGTAVSYLLTPALPAATANKAPFGAMKVVIDPTAAGGYTAGTTLWNYSASQTFTFSHIYQMPLDITNF